MLRSLKYLNYATVIAVLILAFTGCKKEEYALPTAPEGLQNDVIKRSQGPNIVGERIEFAYAMAILNGKLRSAQVEATIAGADGTFLEHRSFYTDGAGGVDVPVVVGTPSVTTGNTTVMNYDKDTVAATLRYYYVIPEAARGQQVSFKFTATSSDDQTVTFNMGPYTISRMDIARKLLVKNNDSAYISIEDLAVYNDADAAAKPGKIDLVYLYRDLATSAFSHALVSPAASEYLPDVILPAGLNRSSKLRKEFGLQDRQLVENLASSDYIDDVDFQQLDFSSSPNYAINLKKEAGIWVETADGRFRAYIYLNEVYSNGTAEISIKRLAL